MTWDLTWDDVHMRSATLAKHLQETAFKNRHTLSAYPVPRGGIFAALTLMNMMHQRDRPAQIVLVHEVEKADFIIDDIVDSGATKEHHKRYGIPFFSLVDMQQENIDDDWIVFPWEQMTEKNGPEYNITRLLQFIGEEPNREGLKETPARVIKSYKEIFAGYKQKPKEVLKIFEDGACDEMVILKDIEFYSMCEHHMQPFFGKAHIGYLPDKRVVGISKLARLLDVYARRLQIQERLTDQICDAIMQYLQPKGAAVVIEAKHFCMICRGVGKQNSKMITSSLSGAFKDDAPTRAEFMSMIK